MIGHCGSFSAGGYAIVTASDADRILQGYRDLLRAAEKQCPPPDESQRKGRRGLLKRSKARNRLEHLRDFEHAVIRLVQIVSPLDPLFAPCAEASSTLPSHNSRLRHIQSEKAESTDRLVSRAARANQSARTIP